MKKIISLIIGAIMLCGVNGIGNAFTSEIPTFEETPVVNNYVEKVQEDNKVVEKSDLSKEPKKEEVKTEIASSSETEKSEEKISEKSTKAEEVKTTVEKKVENQPIVEPVQETPTPVVNNQENVQTNEVPTQENVSKNNPWDSLGITEYEFYNTPAHKWAELDFKKSDYGSYEATLNACKEYGNNYIAQNGGGYWCNSVNSYSGNYLGEDIDFY